MNLKKISPSEAEFNEEFSRSLNYKKRKFCSYLLARLERVGTTGEHLINFEQVNMDHILPQNSLRSKKGKMSHKDYVNDEERLNSIGNLVLVHKKINSSEKRVLIKMLENPGKTYSRDEIGKISGISQERSIDVMITRLRQKIEINPKNPKYLQTIRGSGYVLWIE